MDNLTGRTAIVSGGASGIGKATCETLLRRGCSVAILDVDQRGTTVAAELASRGPIRFFSTDVSREPSISTSMRSVAEVYGSIDILICCAATFVMKGIDATSADWRDILATNVTGTALTVKHCVPYMSQEGGAIVLVSSASAVIAQRGYLTYSVSKGALLTMAKCMALDLSAKNIRVNCICPGKVLTETNLARIRKSHGINAEDARSDPDLGGVHMLGRMATPEEISQAIVFLASDAASFITAAILMADGGWSAL